MEVGDKVKIIARNEDDPTCHEFELGGVGRIARKPDDEGRYGVEGTDDSYWRCFPTELELVPAETQVTATDRPVHEWV